MENTIEINSNEKTKKVKKDKLHKSVSYAKWGIIFVLPFFIAYFAFTLYPQIKTFYYSFFEYYRSGLREIGPKFVGLDNYIALFTPGETGSIMVLKALGNTVVMWLLGAVFQLVLSLILALFFTSTRLNIRCAGFFKSVFYMPNLIMASAFAFLFYAVFNTIGPVNQILQALGITNENIDFISTYTWSSRSLIAFMNFLMWFGNTTILLMAGIMGIDESLFESARMDGASSTRVFFDITLPLLKPILVYVLITSMIGILFFALILKFLDLSNAAILIVNQIIKIISTLLCCVYYFSKIKSKSWFGVILGLIYFLSTFCIFSLLGKSFIFDVNFLYNLFFSMIIGLICAFIVKGVKQL